MKILKSYKKMAKSMLTEHAWDRKFGEPLPTLEDTMKEGPYADDEKQDADASGQGRDDGDTWMAPNGDYGGKYSGEIRYFDDEDQATVWAKKGKEDSEGDDAGDKDDKEEPAGKLGAGDFDRDSQDAGDDKPEHPADAAYRKAHGMEDPTGGDPDDSWDDEEGKPKPKAKRSDRYKDVDTSWHDDPEAVAAQGQQGRWPGQDQDEPKGGAAKEITKDMKSIPSAGGNNVLIHKNTEGHIERHNKPGEGSVFSKDIDIDDVKKAIGEIPEEFYEKGGGVHTTTVPNAGYNLVQKASDIEKDHPNAKKIMVKKQVGYDRDKKEPIMKEVPAYIIDGDKEEFKTDQLNVVVRPSNADFMDDEVKNNPDVKKDLDGGKSHSVLSSFPGDPDVPPAQDWEESGHAIIIPNGGKDADKSNWVTKSTGDDKPEHPADAAYRKAHGRTGKELGKNEKLEINGKMYRRVQEQKETSKKHFLRETYERIGGK